MCICAGQGNTVVSHFVVHWEGRFYCSDSVCSLWPAPFSYLCVSVRILGVLKIVCGWASKTWLLPFACCGLHFWPTPLPGSLSFYEPPHHYIYIYTLSAWRSTQSHDYVSFMSVSIQKKTWFSVKFTFIARGRAHCKIVRKYCIFGCRTHFGHIAASPYAK